MNLVILSLSYNRERLVEVECGIFLSVKDPCIFAEYVAE